MAADVDQGSVGRPRVDPVDADAPTARDQQARQIRITFKLFATLTDYLPAARKYNTVELLVGPDTTIAELVKRFHVPPALVHLVLVNGVYIPPDQRATRRLEGGDALAIWPPVAGG